MVGGRRGNSGFSDVTMSTLARINYRIEFQPCEPTSGRQPAPRDSRQYDTLRVCSFGGQHPGAPNFAMGDGSVRFLKDTTAQAVLRSLGTRGGAEVISADSY